MATKSPKKLKFSWAKWWRHVAVVLSFGLLIIIAFFFLGWLNRDLVLKELHEWYAENNKGTLEIGKIDTNFMGSFPNVGFIIREVNQTNFDTVSDKKSSIFINRAIVAIGPGDLLAGNIRFKKIEIDNAELYSEVVSERSFEYHVNLKRKKQSNPKSGIVLPTWINSESVVFTVDSLKFVSKDTILNKFFDLHVHNLIGNFEEYEDKLRGSINFDITANALGFNTLKGHYFNGARVKGAPKFQLNKTDNTIEIPEFALQIEEQVFSLRADFDVSGLTKFNFALSNDQTDFQTIKQILPDSLTKKLNKYDILKPFRTSLNLNGKFQYGDNPELYAEFSSINNQVLFNDKIDMDSVFFEGFITNNIYESDSLRAMKASKKDVKVYFEQLRADIKDIKLVAHNSYFESSIDASNFIKADLVVDGSNETLAEVLENDNFEFEGGRFKLEASIEGDIATLPEIFNSASGNFRMGNTRVSLKQNGLQLPIENVSLKLDHENSTLRELKINLPNNKFLVFSGRLKNASSVLADNPTNPMSSFVSLDSRELDINELIETAKEFLPESKRSLNDRKNLHDILEAIYLKFHPRFQLELNSVDYNNISLTDVKADLELVDIETIRLKEFDFKYFESATHLEGIVKVPEPKAEIKEPIYIDLLAESSGGLTVFQDLFNIQLVDIQSGNFNFEGEVKGNVQRFDQLLNSANGNLTVKNTKLYYPIADLEIAFDSLAVKISDSNIELNDFQLEVGEIYPFLLSSKIEQFPTFLLDELETTGKINLELNAPYIDADELTETIKSLGEENKDKSLENKSLYKAFLDINKLNPNLIVRVDSLKFKDLIANDIKANVYFENDSLLKVDNVKIRYKESLAEINGSLEARNIEDISGSSNPFNFNFTISAEGKSENLNDYLKTTNFVFESGDFEFEGGYEGQAEALLILNSNAYGELKMGNALANFKAADIQIPVDSLNLEIKNDFATLKKLDIDLPGKSSIEITGSIDNFSSFINNYREENSHISTFTVKAPYLDTRDIKSLLKSSGKKTDSASPQSVDLNKLKGILNDLNDSYYPNATVEIDSLIHNSIEIAQFKSDIGFNNDGAFIVDKTTVDLYDGKLSLAIMAEIDNTDHLPVNIEMEADSINLKKFVESFDHFGNEDLRNTEKLNGLLSYKLKASGIAKDDGSIDMTTLNGTLDLQIDGLVLHNYKPAMENSVLMKDERFKYLEFRPIVQTFNIVNGELIIPRTQIQSTALHVFVEGRLKFEEYINIWLALPWSNLKSNDGLTLPEKKSFEESGSKFYLQLVQDQNSKKERKRDLKVKFKLGNGKMKKSFEKE